MARFPSFPRPAAGRLALLGCVLLLGSCAWQSLPLEPPDPARAAEIERLPELQRTPRVIGEYQPFRDTDARCRRATARTLSGYGLGPEDIARVVIWPERTHGASSTYITGYRAWVRLADQPGHLVVVLSFLCTPQYAYAQGGATVPGGR